MESKEDESPKRVAWQKRLLPLMTGMLVVLTLFFFVASLTQLYYLHRRIEQAPQCDLEATLSMLEKLGPNMAVKDQFEAVRWRTLSTLEEYAMKRRYHQANVLLMSRIWTRYLGFVTGMILALVGAAFILGKLREPETKLDAEGVWKFSITTASPGLVLALLGTILMVSTIVTHQEITTEDIPLYTGAWSSSFRPEGNVQVIPEGVKPQLDDLQNKLKGLKKDK